MIERSEFADETTMPPASGNGYFTFETGGRTDTGLVRDHNEDAFLTLPQSGLWLVADGMGGHAAGDFASQSIVQILQSVGHAGSASDLQARVMERIDQAHRTITDHAATLGRGTIGATLVALLIFDDAYACLWSGDSRIYLMRGGQLTQLTRDHTEVQHLLDNGAITAEEAANWPRKNVITRAIGVSDQAQCDIVTGTLEPGDQFLLCSDGVTEHLDDVDIAELVRLPAAQSACEAMVNRVLERGAKDNTTAVIVHCKAAGGVQ